MENNGIKISPKFTQKDWLDLDLSKNSNENWSKAIEIFQDRIEGRYFKQIEALDNNIDTSIRLFSGFAIMSITCLLIETLEQFWTGNIASSRINAKSKKNFFLFIEAPEVSGVEFITIKLKNLIFFIYYLSRNYNNHIFNLINMKL